MSDDALLVMPSNLPSSASIKHAVMFRWHRRMTVTLVYFTMQVLRIWRLCLLLGAPNQSRMQASQRESPRLCQSRSLRSHGDLVGVTSLRVLKQESIRCSERLPSRGQGISSAHSCTIELLVVVVQGPG